MNAWRRQRHLPLAAGSARVLGALFTIVPQWVSLVGLLHPRPWRSTPARWIPWIVAGLLLFGSDAMGLRNPLPSRTLESFLVAALAFRAPLRLLSLRSGRVAIERSFAQGLAAGMVAAAVGSWVQVWATGDRATLALYHPNVLGVVALLVGAVGVDIGRSAPRLRFAIWMSTTAVVAASGSRSAIMGLAVLALGRWLAHRAGVQAAIRFAFLVSILGVTSVVGTVVLAGLDRDGRDARNANLVRASEAMETWEHEGVRVVAGTSPLSGGLRAFQVTKTLPEPWRRPQISIPLRADTTYTVSTYVVSHESDAIAGFEGWGRDDASGTTVHVRVALTHGGLVVDASGPVTILASTVEDVGDGWRRISASFRTHATLPVIGWSLGPTPDQRPAAGSVTTFAGFMVELGQHQGAYVPGRTTGIGRLGTLRSRLEIWRVAFVGIAESPWIGRGEGRYAGFYQQRAGILTDLASPPAHAHNVWFSVLFERGFVGLAGFLVLMGSVAWVSRRDPSLAVVLGMVFTTNLADATMLVSPVAGPLACYVGYRCVVEDSKAATCLRSP